MSRPAAFLILIAIAACVSGCGSNGNTSEAVTINIEQNRFVPANVTVKAGSRVQFVNVDTQVHQVVSGTLAATTQPVIRSLIIQINEDNTFVPDTFEANWGDTVQWRNNRSQPFVMDIVDSSNTPVVTLSFVRTGQVIAFSSFPGAGFYRYQQQNNSNFFGTIKVFGRPVPDGNFNSLPLRQSGTFTTQFPSPGTFPYFDLDQNDPNRSYITGTITVQ